MPVQAVAAEYAMHSDPTINPGAIEDCSNIDRNCNGDFYDAPDGC